MATLVTPTSATHTSSEGIAETEDKPDKIQKKEEPKKEAAAPEDTGSNGSAGGGASTKKTVSIGSPAQSRARLLELCQYWHLVLSICKKGLLVGLILSHLDEFADNHIVIQ